MTAPLWSAVASAVVVLAGALGARPTGRHRAALLPSGGAAAVGVRVGAVRGPRGRVGRRASAPAPTRRIGAVVAAVVVGTAAVATIGVRWAVVAATVGAVVRTARRRSAQRRARALLVAEVPAFVDLLAVAIAGGSSLGETVALLAEVGWSGRLADELHGVQRRCDRGAALADELESLGERLGPPVRDVTRALVGATRLGAPVIDVLTVVAEQVRADDRRRERERAGRLPVLLLGPLVGCFLPAFVLVVVVPVAVSGLSGVAFPS